MTGDGTRVEFEGVMGLEGGANCGAWEDDGEVLMREGVELVRQGSILRGSD